MTEVEEGIGMTMANAIGNPPVLSKRMKLKQALIKREIAKNTEKNKMKKYSGKAAHEEVDSKQMQQVQRRQLQLDRKKLQLKQQAVKQKQSTPSDTTIAFGEGYKGSGHRPPAGWKSYGGDEKGPVSEVDAAAKRIDAIRKSIKIKKEHLEIEEGLKQARKNVGAGKCWDGYVAKGTKKKDGKEVPNCVPEEVERIDEVAPSGAKYERMIKHIKKGYAKDGELTDKEKSIAYATAWKAKNREKK